jgi:hypothetical protein
MGSNYHIETLAGSSAPTQVNSLTAPITSRVNGLLTLRGAEEGTTDNLWLAALFDRGSTLPFSTDSSRHLSLSILRI